VLLEAALPETSALLAWFPGKDLMAALAPWLEARHLVPDRLRVRLRDWVVDHSEQALDLLGEWQAFKALLHASD
jgi:hypothetical protein